MGDKLYEDLYGPPDVPSEPGKYKAGSYAPLAILRSDGARILRGRRQLLFDPSTVEVGGAQLDLIQCTTGNDRAVTLGIHLEASQDDTNLLAGQAAPVVAQVQWGTEGGDNSAEVDILQGTSFNLGCSYLRIFATIDKQFGNPPVTGPQSRTVSANVYLGAISSGISPQRSFQRLAIAAAAFADFTVPKYATNLDVCRAPVPPSVVLESYRVEQRSFGGFILCQHDVAAGADLARKISLVQGTRIIRFINTGAAAVGAMAVIFGLNL